MNKFIVALFCVFAVTVSAGDCQTDLLAVLPSLTNLYNDLNTQNYTAIERDIEALIPVAETLLDDCAGITVQNNTRLETCLEESEAISALLVPVIQNPEDLTALYTFVLQSPALLQKLYQGCILGNVTQAVQHVAIAAEVEFFKIFNPIKCVETAKGSVDDLKGLIQASKNHENFDSINGHVITVLHRVSAIADDCGLPQPTKALGIFSVDDCLMDADKIAVDAERIVVDHSNPTTIINAVKDMSVHLALAIPNCGIY